MDTLSHTSSNPFPNQGNQILIAHTADVINSDYVMLVEFDMEKIMTGLARSKILNLINAATKKFPDLKRCAIHLFEEGCGQSEKFGSTYKDTVEAIKLYLQYNIKSETRFYIVYPEPKPKDTFSPIQYGINVPTDRQNMYMTTIEGDIFKKPENIYKVYRQYDLIILQNQGKTIKDIECEAKKLGRELTYTTASPFENSK